MLHLAPESLNLDLHAPLRNVSIRFMRYVLVALLYKEASSYSILLKFNYCNFTLLMHHCLGWPGPLPNCPTTLCTPLKRLSQLPHPKATIAYAIRA